MSLVRCIAHSSTVIIGLLVSSPVYAGAWTQPKGQLQYIQTHSYYRTSSFINRLGKRQSQPTYQKLDINPYVEYGLKDDLTIGANAFLTAIHQNSTTSNAGAQALLLSTTEDNIGIGDIEFFVRKRVWQDDGFVVSIQPLFKIPSFISYENQPKIGTTRPDAAMVASAGYGFNYLGLSHFINLDAEYRYRFGREKNQVKLAATAGIQVHPAWMIMPQLFVTQRTDAPKTVSGFAQDGSNDYNLTKLQLSAVYQWSENISIQLGGFYHADAKNTGTGGGGLLSLWKTF